ncbi:MAG: GtrA family protein [Candidatus Pacebacteria bacterium]|nr:GtrA family protein [Candidatus Paceibacterota bacterium]
MKQKLIKGMKFIISGGTAAFVALSLFYVFWNILHIWYLLASILSFLFSVVVGFILQKYFTFENTVKSDTKKQAFLFLFISLINLLINIALMAFFVEILKLDQMLSKIVTLAILALWNFFVYKKFVFKVK